MTGSGRCRRATRNCWHWTDALERLAGSDPRKGAVVELRYFGGLTVEETAEALGVSRDVVMRDWHMARVWLRRELRGLGE